jgi:hypothetical protein
VSFVWEMFLQEPDSFKGALAKVCELTAFKMTTTRVPISRGVVDIVQDDTQSGSVTTRDWYVLRTRF